jgi:hypothetical protein
MPFIRTVSPEDATGDLKVLYDDALKRAGRVYNVVRIQSLHPRLLASSIGLYETMMLRAGSLPRRIREMLATVVSRELDCFY